MVGREIVERARAYAVPPGPVVLAVRDVAAENDRGLPALRGVSMDVRAGEIVGIAAVAGQRPERAGGGHHGAAAEPAGSVTIGGTEVANRPVSLAIHQGSPTCPRTGPGSAASPNLSITDNLIMKRYHDAPIAHGWFVDDAAARAMATGLKDAYAIAAPSIETEARLLSGGNLQRLIFAREIETGPRVMVAVHPTRGLDVGAIEAVHRVLLDRREPGPRSCSSPRTSTRSSRCRDRSP